MNKHARLLCLATAAVSLAAVAAAAAGSATPALPTHPIVEAAARVPQAAQAGLLASARAGDRLVAVGERGIILLSDDHGQHFRQARQVPLDVTLTSVSFADERHGWAVGQWGAVLATDDGGETWQLRRKDTQNDRPLFGVHFFDTRQGVAVGLWSLVLVTEDGGVNWREVKLPPPDGAKKADLNLLGLFADEHGRVYAAAERGMVLRSEDRGGTWSYAATGYRGSFWTGLALPDGVLLAGGLRGSLYRSIDDGRTWERVETGSRSSLTAMTGRGQTVVVVGLDGLVLRSSDAGATFHREVRADHAALTGVMLTARQKPVYLSRQGVVAEPSASGSN
ncbi:WD40/YVTN/BNR-like repeat-containing protein [Roseateles cellulosilyticus]|uniref:YCF48-related protein n=1 Tax=Pelomonas cellulosilytica TaxID=2906762 RepID=A0ABS8XVZ9_9BURK|nr:YCF48-related protein [Pelomonas sp. P8]MCE4554986.1 YCF48-related protein [Pelomonas sp. P8]